MKNTVQFILDELVQFADYIDQRQMNDVVQYLCKAKEKKHRVFFAGAGRSGCIVKAFANRMMHLGFECYVVTDITTPPIQENDILFIISGSGKTTSLVSMANKARSLETKILTITLNVDGDIAKMSDAIVVLPGNTRLSNNNLFTSVQPVGSTFEQLAWLTCDGIVFLLKDIFNLSNEDLTKHHANLE